MLDALVTVPEARSHAISWDQLQSKRWQRVSWGVYSRSRRGASPLLLIAAAWRRLPSEAVFSGRTAAWLHGLDVAPCSPIEVTVPAGHPASHRAGMRFHKARLEASEVAIRDGFRVTSRLRTLADVACGTDLIEAVAILDMALRGALASPAELVAYAESMRGRRGVARFRKAVSLADVSESPMESRLRVLLVLAGLPAPVPQVELFNESGEQIARADLYYGSHRLCIEFDGGHHKDSLAADDRRQNRLVDAGYTLLRFTAADLLGSPERIVALVRGILHTPPRPDFSQNRANSARGLPDFGRNQTGAAPPA